MSEEARLDIVSSEAATQNALGVLERELNTRDITVEGLRVRHGNRELIPSQQYVFGRAASALTQARRELERDARRLPRSAVTRILLAGRVHEYGQLSARLTAIERDLIRAGLPGVVRPGSLRMFQVWRDVLEDN